MAKDTSTTSNSDPLTLVELLKLKWQHLAIATAAGLSTLVIGYPLLNMLMNSAAAQGSIGVLGGLLVAPLSGYLGYKLLDSHFKDSNRLIHMAKVAAGVALSLVNFQLAILFAPELLAMLTIVYLETHVVSMLGIATLAAALTFIGLDFNLKNNKATQTESKLTETDNPAHDFDEKIRHQKLMSSFPSPAQPKAPIAQPERLEPVSENRVPNAAAAPQINIINNQQQQPRTVIQHLHQAAPMPDYTIQALGHSAILNRANTARQPSLLKNTDSSPFTATANPFTAKANPFEASAAGVAASLHIPVSTVAPSAPRQVLGSLKARAGL